MKPFTWRRVIVGSGATPPEPWKPDELDLRRREVAAAEAAAKSQFRLPLLQALSIMAALASTVIAAVSACQSVAATNAATENSAQQSYEGQLTSAISALDAGSVSARTTSMLLIQRNLLRIMLLPLSTYEARQNAYSDYTTVFFVYGAYIRNHAPGTSRVFGPGYGIPANGQISPDVANAADDMERLLSMGPQVAALVPGFSNQLGLDLAHAELYGQYWDRVDFSQAIVYMPRADLRGANLAYSRWGTAYLAGSYLQCADLRKADLSHAYLIGADLRGANLVGALLPKGLQPGQLVGAIRIPSAGWDQGSCLENKAYWSPRNAPVSPR